VDEAHNLIPSKPRSKLEGALLEQFRTIVAEGRKYGLFLIVVSQRPEKLDPLVLSECENRAVMRLRSESVLTITKEMLGLEDLSDSLVKKCLEFGSGRVLLAGPWIPEPKIIYSAARRTVEGGRNLRAEYWGQPD
jgi:DNA helicase HerA-like ATPase